MNHEVISAWYGGRIDIAAPAFASDVVLDGTYTLVSSTRTIQDSGQVVDTFGKHPSGYINYGKDGRMLVLIVADKADRSAPESVGVITDDQRAILFRGMAAYGGTYEIKGRTVEHHIDISWNQAWTGTTQIRDIEVAGDTLIFTTRPAPFAGDGKMGVITLVWRKVAGHEAP